MRPKYFLEISALPFRSDNSNASIGFPVRDLVSLATRLAYVPVKNNSRGKHCHHLPANRSEEQPTGHQPGPGRARSPEEEALAARIQEHQKGAARLSHTEGG